MKVLGVTVLLLLCTAAVSERSFSPRTHPASKCCDSYYTSPNILSKVIDYYETSGDCRYPGVVFLTKQDREVCVNPHETWVQEYINSQERNSDFSGGQ
ncbi:C-C motif chemokine 5-like [Saccopteryx bilineata]|uniref:C-C motif chemokine 5-like n=1 Tax=Saccopteryx bilineata TaxID=59482 RepID=UPI00338ED3B9